MNETTAFGEPNGNGAWQELVKWFETSHSNELMTVSVENEIDSLHYRDSGEQTIGDFIDEFNNLIYEHGRYCGTEPYTESRKLRKFKDSMEGTSKFSTIMDLAIVNQWDLQRLQGHLRIKEVQMAPHNHKVLFGIKQRRQEQEVPDQLASNCRSLGKPVPEDLKLPFEVYKDVKQDSAPYAKFRDLIHPEK